MTVAYYDRFGEIKASKTSTTISVVNILRLVENVFAPHS